MSEYQYYEFVTIDRQLTDEEMDELEEISSRADITRTSWINEYNYGGFRGDPEKVLEEYFDAMLYVANWGAHRVAFRLPIELIDQAAIRPYCEQEALSFRKTKKYGIFDFEMYTEGGGWEDGGAYLDDILPVREELLSGDYRALYLGWLSHIGHMNADFSEDDLEPPVPPGMQKLSPALEALGHFLWLDSALMRAVGQGGKGAAPGAPSRETLAMWVAKQPTEVKDGVLVGLLEDRNSSALVEFQSRFREAHRPEWKADLEGQRRSIGELLALADEEEAAEKERERQRAAKARKKELDALEAREAEAWQEVEDSIEEKKARAYDNAVSLLKGLVELADRRGEREQVEQRVAQLREKHPTKRAFLDRLKQAGL